MNDHDLLDRMTESTAWTQTETIDPAHDISRGQARLRRRRAGVFSAAIASAGVAVLALGPIAGQWMTGPDRASIGPAAGTSSTPTTPASGSVAAHCAAERGSSVLDGRVLPGQDDFPSLDATRLMRVFGKHADPSSRYITSQPYNVQVWCIAGYSGRVKGPSMEVGAHWREGTAEDRIKVQVSPPGDYNDPQLGRAYSHPHLSACKNPPWPAFTPYSCTTRTIGGKRVVVGVSTLGGYYSYLVGYVRPDGQLVTVRVESGKHTDPGTPQPENPIRKPAVSIEQLVAAATDPGMTLR